MYIVNYDIFDVYVPVLCRTKPDIYTCPCPYTRLHLCIYMSLICDMHIWVYAHVYTYVYTFMRIHVDISFMLSMYVGLQVSMFDVPLNANMDTHIRTHL